MRSLIALFCVALLLATLGRLDIVAVAPGQFVVGSRTKVIQPAETGVVAAIHVRDGQAVRQGDLLIELDATLTHVDRSKADDALRDARLAKARFDRSEEHTSELQSLMRISYAVFCLKKKKKQTPP